MTTNSINVEYISEDAIRTIRIELEDLWEKFVRRSATEKVINKHILISIVRIVSSVFNMRKIDVDKINILKRLYRKGGEPIYYIPKNELTKDTTKEDLERMGKLIIPQLLNTIGTFFDERIEMIKMKLLRIFPTFQTEHHKEQVIPDFPEPFEKQTEDIFSAHLPFELEQIINRKKIVKEFQDTKQYIMLMLYEYKKVLLYLITSMNWIVTALNIKKTTMFTQ